MISFLGTVETGLLGLFLFLFRTSLIVVGGYPLGITILKQKLSKIAKSRLQQRNSGARTSRRTAQSGQIVKATSTIPSLDD